MGPLYFWLMLLTLPLPFLVQQVVRLWANEQYNYLPLLFVALLFLFYVRWDRVWRMPSSKGAWLLIAGGVASLLTAVVRYSPWLGTLAWVLFMGAGLLSQHGKLSTESTTREKFIGHYARGLRSVARLWPLAWMLHPLPMNLDRRFDTALLQRAAQISSFSLDYLQVPHRLEGLQLQLRADTFSAVDLCGGMPSPIALVFASLLILVACGRSHWLLPVYMLAACFWSLVMNVLRIVTLVSVYHWYGWNWMTGWEHAFVSYFCFFIAIVLMFSTDRLLQVAFAPVELNKNPLTYAWNWLFWFRERQPTTVVSASRS